MSIKATGEFGLIIRRRSLQERNVSLKAVLEAMEAAEPLDISDELISFGPSFGQEALDTFVKRLVAMGLVYFDDFFEFVGMFPTWCEFRAVLRSVP
jgi:hypothetical protein